MIKISFYKFIACGNIKDIKTDSEVVYGSKLTLTCEKNATDGECKYTELIIGIAYKIFTFIYFH